MDDLVSVIMPAYNSVDFIEESVWSVLEQTYKNLELLIIDDCSTDNTAEVIKKIAEQDHRVTYHKLDKNCGAAIARNTAVDMAKGKYLAFLDSDDLWEKEKLSKQISFMQENNYSFSCTAYGKIDENDQIKNVVVQSLDRYDYNRLLKDCPSNSTIIYDCQKLGKFHANNIRRRNDFVMWLAVIKKAKYCYGIHETLSYHRLRSGSISIDKKKLLKYQWIVYRDIEKLSLLKCCYLMVHKIITTLILNKKVNSHKE